MPGDVSFNSTDEQRRQGRGSGGVTGRGFRPGVSGCPGGRPRGIEARAREHTEEALAALVAALANPKERVAAASVLLSYGWGKPKQIIEANEATSVTVMHLLAARELGDQLLAELGDARPTIEALAALSPPEE